MRSIMPRFTAGAVGGLGEIASRTGSVLKTAVLRPASFMISATPGR